MQFDLKLNIRIRKVLIGIFLSLALIVVLLVIWNMLRNPFDKMSSVVAKTELGEEVVLSPELWGVTNNSVKISQKLTGDTKVKISDSGVITSKGADRLELGRYKTKLDYNGQTKKVYIEVVDTTKPEFTKTSKTITAYNGSESIDVSQYFQVKDESPVTLGINYGNIDFSKEGEHKVEVFAEDSSGNRTTKKCTLKILKDDTSSNDQQSESEEAQYFFNNFASESEANEAGLRIVDEGNASSYSVVDTGFGSWQLVLKDAKGIYEAAEIEDGDVANSASKIYGVDGKEIGGTSSSESSEENSSDQSSTEE